MTTNPLEKLHTIDDLLAMPDDDQRYELIDGEIIAMGTSSRTHTVFVAWLVRLIGNYIEEHHLGGELSGADGTYQLDAANVKVPDVGYILPEKVATLKGDTIFYPFAPDFVIEVKSPSDSTPKMRRLADLYIKTGARLVWTIDYEAQIVRVYRSGSADTLLLGEADMLDGYDVLPGLRLRIADLFAKIEGIH